MNLAKRPSGARYLPSSAFNAYVDIVNPNAGQAADGTPNAETSVATGIHASIAMWRGREQDKTQTRVGVSTYKAIIHSPKTYTVDSGMVLLTKGRRLNIESLLDPDMQGVELHMWCFEESATS